jgi:hypothetical protein
LGEATQEGLYLHAVFSFLFLLGFHACYKWMSCERDVLQSRITDVRLKIQTKVAGSTQAVRETEKEGGRELYDTLTSLAPFSTWNRLETESELFHNLNLSVSSESDPDLARSIIDTWGESLSHVTLVRPVRVCLWLHDGIAEVPATEKKAPAAHTPFESCPTKAKSMAEAAQARLAQMAARRATAEAARALLAQPAAEQAMAPHTCQAFWSIKP